MGGFRGAPQRRARGQANMRGTRFRSAACSRGRTCLASPPPSPQIRLSNSFFSLSVVFVVEKTPSFLTLGTGNGSGRQRGVWTWGRRCGCLHGVVSLYIYTYYTHTNTNARTHTYTYIYIFIFIHTHTQTQTHTHTHTHTHTNTHTHMPSPRVLGAQSLLYRLASPVHALTRIHGDWAVAAQAQ